MNKNIKKIALALIIVLMMTVGVIAYASSGLTSTAETDNYILAISDIIKIRDLETLDVDEESIPIYTLPVGATISLTAKSEGIENEICYYDGNNKKVDTFSMGVDGEAIDSKDVLPVDTTVYYTVTEEDKKSLFMSVDISQNDESKSFFFIVSDAKKEDVSTNEIELIATAKPTDSRLLIDGEEQVFQAYEINNYNYFKLRDIAQVISGTDKQFEVEWDEENDAITITTGESYTTLGGELEIGSDKGNQTGLATQSTVYLDGQEVSVIAYNINDNNYFKLRDLGQALNFAVTWDGDANTILIDTGEIYHE